MCSTYEPKKRTSESEKLSLNEKLGLACWAVGGIGLIWEIIYMIYKMFNH